jgi:hypothetical protein
VGQSYGKRPFVRKRRRWNGNIKRVLNGTRREDVKWIHLARDLNKRRAAEILASELGRIFGRASWIFRGINGSK